MKLLILGGTIFLGRHIVESALARGHDVTLFNRGQHNPDLFPKLEKLRGDRDGDLGALTGRTWDVVIDPSGYVPRIVRASAELLADAVEHYTFISSLSVYADTRSAGIDENAAVATLEDKSVEEVSGETYGALKALCEQTAEEAMPARVLNVRAGLIVGPHDPTDRFTYWLWRVAQGGEILAPARPDYAVQVIDARDLAAWIIKMAEARKTGTYNATGPDPVLSLGQVLETSQTVSESDARFIWINEKWLLQQEVAPWSELPLWLPGSENVGVMQVDTSKALGSGLTFRPLKDTVRDTLDWDATRANDIQRKAGMKPEREKELLAAWHAHTQKMATDS